MSTTTVEERIDEKVKKKESCDEKERVGREREDKKGEGGWGAEELKSSSLKRGDEEETS